MTDAPSEIKYVVTFLTGTVHLPEPTGEWVQDSDGWWREIYRPGYTQQLDGTKTDFMEFIAPVRLSEPPSRTLARLNRRRWWNLFSAL